jgi:hypothetical protein
MIYNLDATASCVSTQSAVASISTSKDDLDFIAQSALGGAIYVNYHSGNDANVSFERTVSDAKRSYKAYKAVGVLIAGGVRDLLEERNNVVIAFTDAPTSQERDAITSCLAAKGRVKEGAPPAPAATPSS